MIHSALSFFFGITVITPIKGVWVALTMANVGMMLALMWRDGASPAGVYFFFMAIIALVQGSPLWAFPYEGILAGASVAWVWSMLPRDKYGRVFALAIGALVGSALMFAVPPPWPHYPPEMYYSRLYSTAVFLGLSLGAAFLTKEPSAMIAVPWFMAVLFAGSQRGFDRWTVGIVTNAMWSCCLICWLAMSRVSPGVSSTPDDPSAHPPTSLSRPSMDT